MSDVDRLFEEFKAAHATGADADPRAFVNRLRGGDRAELTALIEGYLVRAPRGEWDPAAFAASPAVPLAESLSRSLQGQAGLWPSVLPRLRDRARVKRADLVAELADRLGAAGQRSKVAGYYHDMEQGTLPAAGVADEVLDAIAAIVGSTRDALRQAGESLAPAPPAAGSAGAFARTTASDAPGTEALSSAQAPPGDGELDAVDRLFRSGG